jgi:hypothetical protein
MYEDDYKSCEQTYVTLRIFHTDKSPEFISNFLNIEPTTSILKGDKLWKGTSQFNGWFLRTGEKVNSKDSRRHIDYLLDLVLPVKKKIDELIEDGAEIDISCFWVAQAISGGPTLSKQQLSKLSELGVDFYFDFWASQEIDNIIGKG